MNSHRVADCVVVGGGISGLLTARELRAAGLSVGVVERGEVGRESSWAGGGILSPLYPWRYPEAVTALARWGQPRFPELCEELHSLSGVDPELEPTGMVVLDPDEVTPALVWAPTAGAALEGIDAHGVGRLAPETEFAGDAAVWMPAVGHVRNPRIMRALHGAMGALGVEVRSHTTVRQLETRDGRIQAVVTDGGRLVTERVVVTAGAWSRELLAGLQAIDVKPVRGQMVVFAAAPGAVSRIVLAGGRYVIPRRDGRVLVGSTLEDAGFDKHTTAAAGEELAAAAVRLIPALAGLAVEHHWAGLRPGSPDGVPYIGAVPGVEGLYVNTGHYRNGVVLGPGAARLAADLVLGCEPVVDPAPYALERPRLGDFGL